MTMHRFMFESRGTSESHDRREEVASPAVNRSFTVITS